ncbi:hypothetical protein BpHYR1_033013 [Brachionus plicatilis]|uniref:Uncharacterized protein n=1 Tax=Brachionus plicatilis TaxID=10195 RepID=A0A3M7S5F4_BRAPC|nr:hypothetical protein BpHYR1_033013 [Brachionus plicatilis]
MPKKGTNRASKSDLSINHLKFAPILDLSDTLHKLKIQTLLKFSNEGYDQWKVVGQLVKLGQIFAQHFQIELGLKALALFRYNPDDDDPYDTGRQQLKFWFAQLFVKIKPELDRSGHYLFEQKMFIFIALQKALQCCSLTWMNFWVSAGCAPSRTTVE